ncbi:MAG TPA: hypothetical protein ENK02_03895 [Planctomycetes bacterium]|nr:hypothetical protein [Planctomycetota bacterium]
MSPSYEYLKRCSDETGFTVATLEKVVRLGEFAREIGRHPFLRKVLILKGGTALNLGFGPPSRLSVDLDFNYIGSIERLDMLRDRPAVEQSVIELAERAGYRIKKSADSFAGRKIYLEYHSVFGSNSRIEVDLNFLFRVPFVDPLRRELWQPGELERPSLFCVGDDELLAGKLLALLERCAARDAWDLANLAPDLVDCLEKPIFRSRFVAISGMLNHPLGTYGRERLERQLTTKEIRNHLLPMLAEGKRIKKDELLEAAWQRLQPFLDLQPNEKLYVENIGEGRLTLENLFGKERDLETFSKHPALLWKVFNVRKHKEGDL